MKVLPLPRSNQAPGELLEAFAGHLAGKDPATARAYLATVRDLIAWLATKPGGSPFRPELLTETAVRGYLDHLATEGRAPRTRSKALTAISRFARWLQAEGELRRNPSSEIERPTVAQMAPRELSEDQRFVLKSLVERSGSRRMAAFFALAYWAALRISEIAWLRVAGCEVNQRAGAVTIADSKDGKTRTIDLCNEARRALYAYLYPDPAARDERAAGDRRDPESACVFTGQRSAWLRRHGRPDHISSRGLEHLWAELKASATHEEWELIRDVTPHDLRHDWAHRARAAGWTLEEIAVYMGHQTKDGAPAIQTTARYSLPSRQQLQAKLQNIRG